MFRGLGESLRDANVGCPGAVLLTLLTAALIFGLVLLAWWPYFTAGE